MSRREINIFSVSFLDLLSGALAAFIILFVIIPKMTNEEVEVLETLERMEVRIEELDSLLNLARNSIPRELYEQLQSNIQQLNRTINQLRDQIIQLSGQLRDCEEQRRQLTQQLAETQQQLAETQQQLAETQQQLAETQQQLAETQQQLAQTQQQLTEVQQQFIEAQQQLAEAQARLNQIPERSTVPQSGPGQKIYGVNARFAIVVTWMEDLDVDLHIRNQANNQVVSYRNLRSSWGNLLQDVTSRNQSEDMYELFYQTNIVPGDYEIIIHLYENTFQQVTVNGYISIFPFTVNERRVELPATTIRHCNFTRVGIVSLTSNSFTFNR